MANTTGKPQGRYSIMTAEQVYQTNQEWLDDHENAQGWANEEQLIQQQREGRKMAYEPQDDTITLWVNEKKESEKHPFMTGKGLVKGKEVRAAAWKNTSKSGNSYMSIKLSEPQDNGKRFEKPKQDFDF